MAVVARVKGQSFISGEATLFVVQYYDTADPANSGVTGAGVTPVVDPTNVLLAKTITIPPGTTDLNNLTLEVRSTGTRLNAAVALRAAFNAAVQANTIITGF